MGLKFLSSRTSEQVCLKGVGVGVGVGGGGGGGVGGWGGGGVTNYGLKVP